MRSALAITNHRTPLRQVKKLFEKLDENGDGTVTFEEAKKFWKSNFSKVNAGAMFNEVDQDKKGEVSFQAWVEFWENVVAQPNYTEEDVLEEIEMIMEGGAWVDFDDGRTT